MSDDQTTDQPKINPEWVKAGPEADLRPLALSIGELAGAHERLRATVPALEQQLRGADIEVARLREENTRLKIELAACRELEETLKYKLSIAVVALKNARNVVVELGSSEHPMHEEIGELIFTLTGEVES